MEGSGWERRGEVFFMNDKQKMQEEFDILRNKIYDLLFEFALKLKKDEEKRGDL